MSLEKNKSESQVKDLLFNWSQACTCHGIPNLFRPLNNFTRTIWVICLLTSSVICSYLVVTNIISYFNYDSNTQITVYEVNSKFDMPAIKICSQTTFSTPSATAYVLKYLRDHYNNSKINSLKDLMITMNKSKTELDGVLIELQSSLLNVDNATQTLRKSFGYTIEEMLLSCSFNGNPCSTTDFEYLFDIVDGNCYEFNKPNDKNDRYIDRPGKDFGLNVEMFIGPPHLVASQNLFYADRTRGLKLVIHNKTYRPLTIDGIDVQTGACTNIQMSKKLVSHLGSPYESNCVQIDSIDSSSSYLVAAMRNNNINYRQEYCLELCQQAYIIRTCNCSSNRYDNFFFTQTPDLFDRILTRPCNMHIESKCSREAINMFSRNGYKFLEDCKEKYCPLECDTLEYDFFESVVDYPSEAYADFLFLDSTNKIAETFNSENVPKTYDYLARSLVCFSVYFNKLEYTVISETPAMEIIDLISNAGGTLGLFLGVSVLSMIEVIELLFELVLVKFSNKTSPK